MVQTNRNNCCQAQCLLQQHQRLYCGGRGYNQHGYYMNHRQRLTEARKKAFEGFSPDLTGCKDTGRLLRVLELARSGLYSHEIAEHIGVTPKAIQKIFRRYNFPTLQNLAPPLREERPGWKGGVKYVKGYAYVRTPGHPHASKHGSYVAVHRLAIEQHLGRFLLPTEVVHHIDDDTQNNSIENLQVFSSNAEHLAATLKGKRHNMSPAGVLAIREAVTKSNRRRAKKPPQPSREGSKSGASE